MYVFEVFFLMTISNILPQLSCAPFVFDDDDEYTSDPELMKKHKNRKKLCIRNDEGRFFFPINFSYTNVNNNYNCDESNPQQGYGQVGDYLVGINKPGPHKPFGYKPKPHKPHHHGGNKPTKPEITNKPEDIEHDPLDDYTANQQQKPTKRPFHTFVQNHSQGMGVLNTIINGLFGSPAPTSPSPVIPVHETQEDINLPKWKPGQYTTGYNPVNGEYTQDLSQLNSKQLYKAVNNRVNRFLSPILDFF
ncbi:hypothetical protein Trydic_g3123 [Trypoxylus dichotomus]